MRKPIAFIIGFFVFLICTIFGSYQLGLILGISLTAFIYILLEKYVLLKSQEDEVLNNLSNGVFVIDKNNRITAINQKARDLLGIESNHAVGQSAESVLAAWPHLVQQYFQTEEIKTIIKLENEIYLDLRITTIRGLDKKAKGRVIEISDITERIEAEEQMRLQSYALEAAASGIMITDVNGKIQWVNQSFEELTGFSKHEVVGLTPRLQKSGEQNEDFYRNLWKTLLAGRSWRGEMINRRKDGTTYTEEQTIAAVRDNRGEIVNFISVKQDISERKALEKLRDDLIHTIVHDLRNPLTSISVSLEILTKYLAKQPGISSEQKEILEISVSNTRRMSALVSTILDINRFENERLTAKLSVVNFRKLVDEAVKFQVSLAKSKGLELINDVADDFPVAEVDIGLIGRVLQNLIDNAIKFTPSFGSIKICAELSPEAGWFRVKVEDSGPGIPEELRPRLFQKFSSGTGDGHGTGLGLAYCRLAVEAHGGRIWCEFPQQGGTIFFFDLPLATEQ